MSKIKLDAKYIKKIDVKSPYILVNNLKILDEEIKNEFYLMDTGCDYDIAISEIFISEKVKEELIKSENGKIESDPDGIFDRLLTTGIITLHNNYSKDVFICIMYHSRFRLGERIIGIGIINDFLATLDPFKEVISMRR